MGGNVIETIKHLLPLKDSIDIIVLVSVANCWCTTLRVKPSKSANYTVTTNKAEHVHVQFFSARYCSYILLMIDLDR